MVVVVMVVVIIIEVICRADTILPSASGLKLQAGIICAISHLISMTKLYKIF